MKKYPKYKETEVIWVKSLPDNWEELRVKYFSVFRNGYSFKGTDFYEDEKYPVVRIGDIQDGKVNLNEAKKVSKDIYEEAKKFSNKKGDILLALTGATIGKSAIYDTDEISLLNQRVAALRPNKKADIDFLKYLIEAPEFKTLIDFECYGGAQENIGKGQITSAKFPIPSLPEQHAIVRFLDYKTGQIDTFIANRQKQIELLKEQKAGIINKAVTKGINPNAKMKDSGIEWIGEVPEHWEVMELKRLVNPQRKITYGIVQPGEADPTGRYMIRGQDYSKGWASAETIFKVSDEVEKSYARSRVIPGDILLTIVGAGCGNLEIVPDWLDGANLTQTTARIAVDQRYHNSNFIYYSMVSEIGQANVNIYMKGAAQPGLNLGHVAIYKYPIPSKKEQEQINSYINKECAERDKLIEKYQKQIDLMQEYRTSLISQAVTGKIDVREWQPKKQQIA
jgi:type I restriction enzyme S subunit